MINIPTRDEMITLVDLVEDYRRLATGEEVGPLAKLALMEEMSEETIVTMNVVVETLFRAQRMWYGNNFTALLDATAANTVPTRGATYTKERWGLILLLQASFWAWVQTPLAEGLPTPSLIFASEYVQPPPPVEPPPVEPPIAP